MNDHTIKAEGISKRYNLQTTTGQGWRRNRRSISEELINFGNRLRNRGARDNIFSFWALKDVSFQADPGDTVGVIGRNGAGKSTLLRILSRVTQPTSGRAVINGRVGSLLEVGTGFHSELTGRENIFISGSIIGMSRAEIKRKFDEIVEFSGVHDFLDTPVKRFSTGMEVRLAFSVAVHLQPEVLLVDEVLSVGDASFQQKSLGKIREVSQNGGTVLFVSHNMTTVSSICNKAMVLDHGRVVFPLGVVNEAIEYYLNTHQHHSIDSLQRIEKTDQAMSVSITKFVPMDENGFQVDTLTSGMPVTFKIDYENRQNKPLQNTVITLLIKTPHGDVLANLSSTLSAGQKNFTDPAGTILCKVKKLPLMPGNILISLILESDGKVVQHIEDAYVGSIDRGGKFTKKEIDGRDGWVIVDNEWVNPDR